MHKKVLGAFPSIKHFWPVTLRKSQRDGWPNAYQERERDTHNNEKKTKYVGKKCNRSIHLSRVLNWKRHSEYPDGPADVSIMQNNNKDVCLLVCLWQRLGSDLLSIWLQPASRVVTSQSHCIYRPDQPTQRKNKRKEPVKKTLVGG